MTMGRSEYNQTNTGAYDYTDRLVAGADVYGSDNEKIGTIADVGQQYFLVQKGWLFIKDLYLPTSTIARTDGDNVYLSLTKHEAEQMGRDELPTEGDAWYGSRGAGYADTATTTTNRTATGTTGYTTDREVSRDATYREGENISVPVVEEQLKAGVRETEAGTARIVREVHQEQQSIDVPVEREEVYVTERAVNRPATEADMSMQDRTIDIPLREQEVVTQKQAVVTGEVNVRKEVKRDTERVSDTVRREEVHVEDPTDPRVHVEGDRTTGTGYSATDRTADTGYTATGRTRAADYDEKYTVGGQPTDTAYDRTGMAGDRYDTTDGEGILDRAKEKLRESTDEHRNS